QIVSLGHCDYQVVSDNSRAAVNLNHLRIIKIDVPYSALLRCAQKFAAFVKLAFTAHDAKIIRDQRSYARDIFPLQRIVYGTGLCDKRVSIAVVRALLRKSGGNEQSCNE